MLVEVVVVGVPFGIVVVVKVFGKIVKHLFRDFVETVEASSFHFTHDVIFSVIG